MTLDQAASTTFVGILGSSTLWIIGEATAAIPEGVTVVGATAVGGGFVVWLARYLITEYVPKQSAEFKQAVIELTKTHEAGLAAIVVEFREEVKEQRAQQEREIGRLLRIFEQRTEHPADASRPENVR